MAIKRKASSTEEKAKAEAPARDAPAPTEGVQQHFFCACERYLGPRHACDRKRGFPAITALLL